MKTLLIVIGVMAVLAGLVFVGQGSGYFPYPSYSFMIRQTQWIYYGAAIVAVGMLLLAFALR